MYFRVNCRKALVELSMDFLVLKGINLGPVRAFIYRHTTLGQKRKGSRLDFTSCLRGCCNSLIPRSLMGFRLSSWISAAISTHEANSRKHMLSRQVLALTSRGDSYGRKGSAGDVYSSTTVV